MAVKMRLTRLGDKKSPFYRIVVSDSRKSRDGEYVDQIGTFDPISGDGVVNIDNAKASEWLAKGAQPTDRLQKLFAGLGLCEAPVVREQPKKSAPRAKTVERMKEKEEKARAAAEAAAAEASAE